MNDHDTAATVLGTVPCGSRPEVRFHTVVMWPARARAGASAGLLERTEAPV